jgi:hypothetical protein
MEKERSNISSTELSSARVSGLAGVSPAVGGSKTVSGLIKFYLRHIMWVRNI